MTFLDSFSFPIFRSVSTPSRCHIPKDFFNVPLFNFPLAHFKSYSCQFPALTRTVYVFDLLSRVGSGRQQAVYDQKRNNLEMAAIARFFSSACRSEADDSAFTVLKTTQGQEHLREPKFLRPYERPRPSTPHHGFSRRVAPIRSEETISYTSGS